MTVCVEESLLIYGSTHTMNDIESMILKIEQYIIDPTCFQLTIMS